MISVQIIFFDLLLLLGLTGFVSTQLPTIISNYSSVLTVNNERYPRYSAPAGNYYYEAIPIRVNTDGTYTFKSSSTIGDTFGYLYQGNFYPSYPQYNIVAQDDDSAGNGQFQITANLRSDITYILVFTTYAQGGTGSFSIVASGPDYVFVNPTEILSTTISPTGPISSCPVNEVLFGNHCYYLDGNGGKCLAGYSLGSEVVLAQIANSFTGLNYKTAVSDNCCVKTSAAKSTYGSLGNQCNVAGPFKGGPILNGGGCSNYASLTAKQLSFCMSN